MKIKLKMVISWLLVVVWMIVIFNFSNMNSTDSNKVSKGTIDKVITNTTEVTNKVGITDIHIDSIEKSEIVEKLNMPVRNVAHCFCYFVLSILVYIAFKCSEIRFDNSMVVILLFCFIYSFIDEYHQTFIDGRTGQFTDIFIDTFGSFIGLIFIKFFNYLRSLKGISSNR